MKIVQVKVYNEKSDFVFQQQYTTPSDTLVAVHTNGEVKGHYIKITGGLDKETVFVPHGFVFRVTELEEDKEAAFFERGRELAKSLDKQAE